MSGNWPLSAWRATGTAARQRAQPREGAPGPACAEKARWLPGDDRRRARAWPAGRLPRWVSPDRSPRAFQPRIGGRRVGRGVARDASPPGTPGSLLRFPPQRSPARGQRATPPPLCSAWVQALADACAALSTGAVLKSRAGGIRRWKGRSWRIQPDPQETRPGFLAGAEGCTPALPSHARGREGGWLAKAPRAEGSQRLTPPPTMAPPIRHPQQFSPEPGEIDGSFLLFTCSPGWSCP